MIGLILFKYELTSWFYVFLLDLLISYAAWSARLFLCRAFFT